MWQEMAPPVVVSDEPLIQSGRDLQVRGKGECIETPPEDSGDEVAIVFGCLACRRHFTPLVS